MQVQVLYQASVWEVIIRWKYWRTWLDEAKTRPKTAVNLNNTSRFSGTIRLVALRSYSDVCRRRRRRHAPPTMRNENVPQKYQLWLPLPTCRSILSNYCLKYYNQGNERIRWRISSISAVGPNWIGKFSSAICFVCKLFVLVFMKRQRTNQIKGNKYHDVKNDEKTMMLSTLHNWFDL